MLKQQAAVEFIITYSWAILIISLFVILVLLISGTRPPQTYLQSSCNIQPLFPCTDSLLAYNSTGLRYYIVFSNQLGSVIYLPQNPISVNSVSVSSNLASRNIYGSCFPSFVSPGATVLCNTTLTNFKPNVGSQVIINFILNYNICGTSNQIACEATCTNANSICPYNSSGYSIQTVAPSGIRLYSVEFQTDQGGTIVLNNVTYFGNTIIYLPTGNYVIYAQPGPGSASNILWTTTPPGNVIPIHSQTANLILGTNTILKAHFS
jgi:hypothetical protein